MRFVILFSKCFIFLIYKLKIIRFESCHPDFPVASRAGWWRRKLWELAHHSFFVVNIHRDGYGKCTCQIYPRIVFQRGDIVFRTLTLLKKTGRRIFTFCCLWSKRLSQKKFYS